MSWKMTEKPRTVLASPALIREFVEMEPAPSDRPLSERRLQVYERILRAGEFRPVTWASVLCGETHCTYRVNGKHTSTLLSKQSPVPEFYVTVERYQCDKLTEVANLYNTFDSKLGSRTTNDVNLAFAATVRELDGVPRQLIHLSVTAIAAEKWQAAANNIPPAERAEELLDNCGFVTWLYGVATPSAANRHLLRSPVVRAMLATYGRAPYKAKEFWMLVRDESAPDRGDPTRVLARYLVRSSLGGRHGRTVSETKKSDPREMYVKCLHAWNAWRKGESTSLAYYPKADLPAVSK